MKNIIASLIMAMFVVGCASRGALTLGTQFEDTSTCPKDRYIIYKDISVNTVWDTQEQSIEFSWQCTKYGSVDGHDTYRVKKVLTTYKPEPPPKREREFHGGRNNL